MSSSDARLAAERYVRLVNNRDLDALVGLFAPDAVVLHALGTFAGREAVRGFYRDVILAAKPVVTATSWVEDGPHCVFEMEAQTEVQGRSLAIDRLTVGTDGGIERLAIYFR